MPFNFFKKKKKGDESKDNESSTSNDQAKDVPAPNPSRTSGHNKSATETALTEKMDTSKKASKKHNRNTSLTSSTKANGTTPISTSAVSNADTTDAVTTTKGRFVVTRATPVATTATTMSHLTNGNSTNGNSNSNSNSNSNGNSNSNSNGNGNGKLGSNGSTSGGKRVLIEVETAKTDLKEAGQYTKEDMSVHELPLLRHIQDLDKKKQVLIRKLRLCCVVYTFDPDEQKNDKEVRGMERKRLLLVEIVEYLSSNSWGSAEMIDEVLQVLEYNLFRPLPTTLLQRPQVKGDEEEEPFQDPRWPHLQLVYELCLRFLISNDVDKQLMQAKLNGKFLYNVIKLFESEDMRERDYLKTILHRIYGRFMLLRTQIRVAISHECYKYVYSKNRGPNGLAEFLDIFSSIINGFAVPVKGEHKEFLRNVLIPLHKCEKYEMYFNQLADCCVLFVNKDPEVASVILGGLLKFWPHLSPTKQAFFLREMLSIVGALVEHEKGFEYQDYKTILMSTLDRILVCVGSTHFQVADTALTLLKDTVIVYLSKREKDYVWRKLFALLKENIRGHWNSTIVQMSEELQHFYEGVDSEYWHSLDAEFREKREQLNKELQTNQVENSPNTPNSPSDNLDERLSLTEDKLTKQVSLVHEFDQRQLNVLRDQKHNRRAVRWEQVRMAAQFKLGKPIDLHDQKDNAMETIDTGASNLQAVDNTKENKMQIEVTNENNKIDVLRIGVTDQKMTDSSLTASNKQNTEQPNSEQTN